MGLKPLDIGKDQAVVQCVEGKRMLLVEAWLLYQLYNHPITIELLFQKLKPTDTDYSSQEVVL